MRTRGRVILGASFVLVSASLALIACVGDDPSTDGNANPSDASTSGDTTTSADTAVTDTGSTSTDSGDAATETFDGANPGCNDLFPQDAPFATTIECDGSVPATSTGGTISPGRYYLADEKFVGCPTGIVPYSDVVDIEAAPDGGFIVNSALNRAAPLNERLTLLWAVDTPSNTFSQYTSCGGDGGQQGVRYSVTSDGLSYFIVGFGNVTFKAF